MRGSRKKVAAERRLFEEEARPHLDTLYSTALRLTRSQVDAEDLVQDTLVRAYRFFDRFEAGTNFKAWLLRIEMNTFVNRYRRSTRERQVFDGPETATAALMLGEAEVLRVTVERDSSGYWLVHGGFRMRVWPPALGDHVGRRLILLVRPAWWTVDPKGEIHGTVERTFPGPTGQTAICDLGGARVTVSLRRGAGLAEPVAGGPISLRLSEWVLLDPLDGRRIELRG